MSAPLPAHSGALRSRSAGRRPLGPGPSGRERPRSTVARRDSRGPPSRPHCRLRPAFRCKAGSRAVCPWLAECGWGHAVCRTWRRGARRWPGATRHSLLAREHAARPARKQCQSHVAYPINRAARMPAVPPLDSLVLARCGFNHSADYRSAKAFGDVRGRQCGLDGFRRRGHGACPWHDAYL